VSTRAPSVVQFKTCVRSELMVHKHHKNGSGVDNPPQKSSISSLDGMYIYIYMYAWKYIHTLQAASQLRCLKMVSPEVWPFAGIICIYMYRNTYICMEIHTYITGSVTVQLPRNGRSGSTPFRRNHPLLPRPHTGAQFRFPNILDFPTFCWVLDIFFNIETRVFWMFVCRHRCASTVA